MKYFIGVGSRRGKSNIFLHTKLVLKAVGDSYILTRPNLPNKLYYVMNDDYKIVKVKFSDFCVPLREIIDATGIVIDSKRISKVYRSSFANCNLDIDSYFTVVNPLIMFYPFGIVRILDRIFVADCNVRYYLSRIILLDDYTFRFKCGMKNEGSPIVFNKYDISVKDNIISVVDCDNYEMLDIKDVTADNRDLFERLIGCLNVRVDFGLNEEVRKYLGDTKYLKLKMLGGA